ncbi:SpaH/EbpB family LPXTG-anchored major pilin [Propionicicella superfundia]|uniref:SpaH/EbpB family LPXTG-anchored major pilin n=1 Tax=Propionicicella superfundia TaxID=348582 RepID=UPI0005673961|nr:SpaH/EbpB family LPXTG-anchored major pilin [Propionicicella superfundia]
MKYQPSKGLRAFAAGVLAVGLAALAAPLAAAAPTIPDPDATGSLTVHKYAQPDAATGLPNDGTEVTSGLDSLEPLPGVTFTVQQVGGIDLSTAAGWEAAQDLSAAFDAADAEDSVTSFTPAGAGSALTLDPAVSGTTGADGAHTFADLPIGLYLVTETVVPAGATPSAPFLVTIPVTKHVSGADDTWLYDVHAYPKNQTRTATKSVSDATSVKLGDPVTWTILAEIQADPAPEGIKAFKITDALDSRLDYVSYEASIVDAAGAEVATLDEGTDFAVTEPATAGDTFVIDFKGKADGLDKLVAADGKYLKLVINTTVNSLGADGVIPNEAVVYPNEASYTSTPGDGTTPPLTTNEVDSKWGGVTVKKVDPAGGELAGAKFVVVTALIGDAPDFTTAVDLGGTTVATIDGQTPASGAATVFESGADGQVAISGLRYSCYADGADIADCVDPGTGLATADKAIQYWLVEIEAPAGYSLLAQPVPFQVSELAADAPVLQVTNVEDNAGFQLPLTGGTGTALFVVGGALLIGLCVVLVVVNRRRSAARH